MEFGSYLTRLFNKILIEMKMPEERSEIHCTKGKVTSETVGITVVSSWSPIQ